MRNVLSQEVDDWWSTYTGCYEEIAARGIFKCRELGKQLDYLSILKPFYDKGMQISQTQTYSNYNR